MYKQNEAPLIHENDFHLYLFSKFGTLCNDFRTQSVNSRRLSDAYMRR